MAYRKIEKEKPIKRVFQDITTQNVTLVQNGATAYLAVPCWYMEVRQPERVSPHDRDWHDHIGWPNPDRPDCSCQNAYHVTPYLYSHIEEGWEHIGRYLDMSHMFPIHLLEEGYNSVEVAFTNAPEGLTSSGYISDNDDWVVRFMIHPMCEAAIEDDYETSYTVFVTGTIDGKPRRDIVAKGTLKILAGPISQEL